MTSDRRTLLDFLETIRDGLMTPMDLPKRAKWIAEAAYAVSGVITLAKLDDEKEAKKKKK